MASAWRRLSLVVGRLTHVSLTPSFFAVGARGMSCGRSLLFSTALLFVRARQRSIRDIIPCPMQGREKHAKRFLAQCTEGKNMPKIFLAQCKEGKNIPRDSLPNARRGKTCQKYSLPNARKEKHATLHAHKSKPELGSINKRPTLFEQNNMSNEAHLRQPHPCLLAGSESTSIEIIGMVPTSTEARLPGQQQTGTLKTYD